MTIEDEGVRQLIIIGSGPAGYAAATYAARAQLRPVVLEGSVTAGGALMNTTEVENYPGFDEPVLGPELMGRMRSQAERFGAELVADDAVEVGLGESVKRVVDGAGRVYRAHAVILAMGSGYRSLGLSDEKRLSGHGVSWCATCDGFFFREREVAVVGGGDTALEEAMFLTRFASTVHLVHRRGELRASKVMQERAMATPGLNFVWNSEVTAIYGDRDVTGVRLRDTLTDETSSLAISGLFIAIGHDPRSGLVADQVDLDRGGYVTVDHPNTRTNLSGVFACGDLVDSIFRQAITAAGTGCSAALDAERFLATRGG